MKKRKTILKFFFTFFLLHTVCFAQTDLSQYSVQRLTPDDGLSQGSNYFRFEDSRGFMWLTGNDAVNRYDGSMVKVYNLNRYFKGCPNLQQGYGFAEDDKSNIYIGSIRGLYIYHRNTDKFTLQKIYTDPTSGEAMPFGFYEGKIWCFNKKYEIAAYDVNTKAVSIVTKIPLAPLRSIHIYDLEGNAFYYRWPFFDKQNNFWFIDSDVAIQFNSHSKKLTTIKIGASLKKDIFFYCSYYNSAANEILLGIKEGFIMYNISSAQEKFVSHIGGVALEEVQSICSNNMLIALSCKSGIFITDKQMAGFTWVDNSEKKYVRYYASAFDKAQRLWICSDGLGQVIYDFSLPLLPRLPGENKAFAGLKGTGVSSFAEFANGDITTQYTYLINGRTKKLEIVNFPIGFDGYFFGSRTSTDKIRKGIWLTQASYNNKTLKIYFTSANKIPTLRFTINESDSIGIMQELKILDDGRILGAFSSGLYWLKDGATKKINDQPYKNPFTISLIGSNRFAVSYLNNTMWLAEYNGSDEVKFLHKILPGVQSFYLQEDCIRHQYWVGTNTGVYLLDKDFKTVKLFDANNGLAGTYIYGLLLDDEGNAWCSHQRGLSCINAKTYQIINFDKSDGIQDWDFNNRAFHKAVDGTLYFGGVSGFNYFKPPLKPKSFYEPEVYVDEILVNNKTWLFDSSANEIKRLDLSHTENNIAFKTIVKDLYYGKNRQLIYRVQETDSTWKYLPNNRTISFNSLSPGTYTLELGTYSKFDNREISQKTILIRIAAPFYLKAWFWILFSILVTALLFGIYSRQKIKKQQAVFNQQLILEQQRNKITADLHDNIGASLSSLQVNSSIANQLINKDVGQAKLVLKKIENQARNLANTIGDIIWSMKPGKDEFMTMSSRIKNFANDILSATDIEYEIKIDNQVDALVRDITIRKNIVFITREAINNAVKYSKASKVWISLQVMNQQVELLVKDNGAGFIEREVMGNGISNMQKRAEEINGHFSIRTALEQGTEIRITISVP